MSNSGGNHSDDIVVSCGHPVSQSTDTPDERRSPPPDGYRELLDDGYPRWVVIRSSGTSGSFHLNAGTVEDPEPACCSVIRREDTYWRRVEREYHPFEEPCTQPSCFGDSDEQEKTSYTVSEEQCSRVNYLAETTQLTWHEIARRAGITPTSAQRHAKEECWHDTGRNHTLGE